MAFEYAGDLWVVSRSGGQARRLTATPGVEIDPYFSPDGSQIAFTATVAGNTDVYVAPAAGGDPRRLTYHPGVDRVRGWTPDGRRVVFASARASAPQQAYFRLWTTGLKAGFRSRCRCLERSPAFTLLMVDGWHTRRSRPRSFRNGTRPVSGGITGAVVHTRRMTLADYSVEKLPWSNSNDTHPMWVGDTVYFLSDRNHTVNLRLPRRHEKSHATHQSRRLRHHERVGWARRDRL